MSYYGPLLYSESSTIYYRHTTLPMPYTESSTLSNRPSTPTSQDSNNVSRDSSAAEENRGCWDYTEGAPHRSVNQCHVPRCSHWPRADIRAPRKESSGPMFSPYLRQLWTIRRALSDDNARMILHALISNRVDYCNSILHQNTLSCRVWRCRHPNSTVNLTQI